MPAGNWASPLSPAGLADATEYGARSVVSHTNGIRLSLRRKAKFRKEGANSS
jgi:hypothetical protein